VNEYGDFNHHWLIFREYRISHKSLLMICTIAKPPKTEIQNASGLWSGLFLSNDIYKENLEMIL